MTAVYSAVQPIGRYCEVGAQPASSCVAGPTYRERDPGLEAGVQPKDCLIPTEVRTGAAAGRRIDRSNELTTMTTQHDTLWGLIEPWLAAERVELDDLELTGSGTARTLRLLVDGEGGVDIDRIAELSLGISGLLDAQSDLDGPYQLEVSSPGLERKLRTPRHFHKSIGREVNVKVRREGVSVVIKGELSKADEQGFVVRSDGTETTATYDEVTSAKTVFRWQAAPKPGKK